MKYPTRIDPTFILLIPVPAELKVTSKDADGYIMSLEHTSYDVKGVQYHPDSVLTPEGAKIIGNWLKN